MGGGGFGWICLGWGLAGFVWVGIWLGFALSCAFLVAEDVVVVWWWLLVVGRGLLIVLMNSKYYFNV